MIPLGISIGLFHYRSVRRIKPDPDLEPDRNCSKNIHSKCMLHELCYSVLRNRVRSSLHDPKVFLQPVSGSVKVKLVP